MKKKLHYVLSRIFDTPLMIQQQKLETILTVLRPRLPMMFEGDYEPEPLDPEGESSAREETPSMDSVAVIPIHGVLVHRATGMAAMCGMMDYQVLTQMVADAAADPAIKAILLDVDSPGGEAHGCFEFADSIYEARGTKPIIAMVNEMACSAAYAIASAADKIYVTKTSIVGSIGVIATHVDASKADEMAGLKYNHVIAGKKKADWTEHEPLSDRGRAALQSHVSSMYQIFVSSVARNRGLDPESVAGTEAGLFLGKAGVVAGLADEVIPLSALSEKLQEDIDMKKPKTQEGTPAAGVTAATDPIKLETNPTQPTSPAPANPQSIDREKDEEEKDEENEDEGEEETPKKGAKQSPVLIDTKVASEIFKACTVANKPELASQFVEEGLTLEQAQSRLFQTLSAEGDVKITSAVNPTAKVEDEATTLLVQGMQAVNESNGSARRR